MTKEYKNVSANYLSDTEINVNNKKYIIHNVIDGEDILVNFDTKYPSLEKVLKPSKERINDGCIYQSMCGGCQFMHINYDYEIKKKELYLNKLFKEFDLGNIKVLRTDNIYNYRNKCQMVYKLSNTKKVVSGMYEEYSHKIVTVNDCMLQSIKANEAFKEINKILTKNKIEPYDEKKRSGIIRHVFIRYAFNTEELMIVFVTNGEFFPGRNNVIKDLLKTNLKITTIIQNYNSRDTSIVLGDKERILYGNGYIIENVLDYKFKISSKSFFQVNTKGMEKLYTEALNKANITKNDIVIDAYSGIGTITLFASKYAKKVIGVELNKQAVSDAIQNAKINKIQNVEFIADDATNFITKLAKTREKIDVLIMDPPREGSTPQFINAIKYLNVKKIIYISCGPESLKRDLRLFMDNDYVVESITGVDMFPRTQHLENIAIIKKDDELEYLENLVKKNNTKKYKENKLKYIPKADIEMMREDKYEATGNKKQKKYRY